MNGCVLSYENRLDGLVGEDGREGKAKTKRRRKRRERERIRRELATHRRCRKQRQISRDRKMDKLIIMLEKQLVKFDGSKIG